MMASNSRISVHRNSDSLHLKLMGDFDGSSAWELLNVLKKSVNGAFRVFIHTNSLKNIYPFGRDTLQKNLRDMEVNPVCILFTGEKASRIAPEKSSCL